MLYAPAVRIRPKTLQCSSMVEQFPHKEKVVGSNPTTGIFAWLNGESGRLLHDRFGFDSRGESCIPLAQRNRARGYEPRSCVGSNPMGDVVYGHSSVGREQRSSKP